MAATVDFYRRLGIAIPDDHDDAHVAVRLPGGLLLEFDGTAFVPQWDSGWDGSTGSGLVIGFAVASREAVDALYADICAAGYRGRQPPYDAFWGAPPGNQE